MREFKFNFRTKEMKSGLLMGVCREFPFIIVKDVDIDSVSLQIQEHIINYVNTFPEKAQDIILSISKKVEENNININNDKLEKENSWDNHQKLLTLPTKH